MTGTTSASRKLKPLPPPHLRWPCVNLLTKLLSRKWIRISFFFSLPLNIHNFSLFYAIFRVLKFFYLLKKWKNKKLLATLVIFSFFLLKWNYGKLGYRYAIFLFFFIFWTQWKKWKNGANKYNFFIFPFFYFWGKVEKQKNELGIEDYFIFLTFQTISKIKNGKISLLAVYTVFRIFKEDFKIRKMKKLSIFLTVFLFSVP